jgi:long-subunit acyl-CoA synthetase (AMP-forming)
MAAYERDRSSVFLSGSDEKLTTAAALRSVHRVAEVLVRENVRVLAIAADNSPDWVIADLAAQRAGITVVPLPPFFSIEQLTHVLADSEVDAIAADETGSRPLLSFATRFAAELTPGLSLLRFESLMTRIGPAPRTAKISYTSGTTGTPKGVCLAQTEIDRVARSLCDVTEALEIERHLCLLPLATLLENIAGVYAPLIAGAQIVLPSLAETGVQGASDLDAGRLIECLHRYEAESIILLPQLLAALVAAVEQGATLPESLKFAAVGGGVVGMSLLSRADRAGIPAFEGYGLTECCSVVSLNTPAARRIGSVGRPLPHCAVRIGEDSEVFVSGAGMTGYLGAESAAGSEREVATGDIGYLDSDGYLFIDGRKKNVLITSFGRNLSPEWVEASLTATASIAQAALYGDGRPFNVAVVVPAGDASTRNIESDIERVNQRLPDYARIRRWICAHEPFSPLHETSTENGRIRRRAIELKYENEIETCYADEIWNYA